MLGCSGHKRVSSLFTHLHFCSLGFSTLHIFNCIWFKKTATDRSDSWFCRSSFTSKSWQLADDQQHFDWKKLPISCYSLIMWMFFWDFCLLETLNVPMSHLHSTQGQWHRAFCHFMWYCLLPLVFSTQKFWWTIFYHLVYSHYVDWEMEYTIKSDFRNVPTYFKAETVLSGKCLLGLGDIGPVTCYDFTSWRHALRLWLEVKHVRASAHTHTHTLKQTCITWSKTDSFGAQSASLWETTCPLWFCFVTLSCG